MEAVAISGSCSACGGPLVPTQARSAFWFDERLVVVEGIPALECPGCGERFFDDAVAIRLDLLRGTRFPDRLASAELRVPVFAFDVSLEAEP